MCIFRSGKVRLANKSRGSRGAAALEFALVLPILLLVLGGIVDFARAYMELQMMTNAASEGARMAIISTDPSVDDASVTALVKSFFPDPENADVTITPSIAVVPAGGVVSVTVERDFDQIFLGFFQWFDASLSPLPETLSYTASGNRM